ncbi:MAG: ATP-binding protein [Burkholderiales bacterium]
MPQRELPAPFIGALSKQAISRRDALIGEQPFRPRKPGRRRRAEGLPGQSDSAFRQLFDISPTPQLLWRRSDSIAIMFNVAAARLFGPLGPDGLVPQTLESICGVGRAPDSRYAFIPDTGAGDAPMRLRNAAGDPVWALVASRSVSFGGEACVLTSVTDITGRMRAQSALARLNAELEARIAEHGSKFERANRELESFSYAVAHDLRAPLRAIQGFGKMLLADHGGRLPADGLENLQRVLAAATRMGEMIDGLLQLSRLTRQPLTPADVDIAALSHELMAELAGADPARSAEVVVPDALPAQGDAGLLKIALRNLLGNAWKFTSGVGRARIEVGEAQTGRGRAFFVRDNGTGFDMSYAGKLFKVFQRLHSASEFEGAGVGLATVERIIHRHGGAVWAEASPGLGAAFYFTLPAQAGTPATR